MCDCIECEQMLQPYLDRVLSAAEVAEAKEHLATCDRCARRYVFEEKLRMFVRQAAETPISPELKQRLADLRIAL
jgi:anti-sigma factor RsiW